MTKLLNMKDLRAYCGSKIGAVEDFPFDQETLTFKVMGKIFALLPLEKRDQPPSINLKCEPQLAQILRSTYDAVQPGYHMSKKHWNTVIVDGSIPADEILEMIDHSYLLVVKSLSKLDRQQLQTPKP
ncbi:MAG: MmcQ/YjbR family DNA-binding protein [Anaerolineae bacterium]|jgi:predicted DNA-binding protein (MmcQ/YjbR family)|nr:MmcQ/YjbR family DNA-binding protein [Anaerolineae bacterium]